MPNGFSPSSASPESLRRIRLNAGFRLAAMMHVSVSRRLFRRGLGPRGPAAGHRLPRSHAHDVVVGEQEEVGLVEELEAGGIVDAGIRDGDEPRTDVVHLVLEALAGLGMEAAHDELIA